MDTEIDESAASRPDVGMLTIINVTMGLLVTVRLSDVPFTIADIPVTSI